MMIRELTEEEINSLSNRHGVKGRAVEDFLLKIGGISIDAAYERLNRERKMNKWNLQTVSAISDGIVLATTKCKKSEDVKKKAGVKNPSSRLTEGLL
jgi:hypothetical protein